MLESHESLKGDRHQDLEKSTRHPQPFSVPDTQITACGHRNCIIPSRHHIVYSLDCKISGINLLDFLDLSAKQYLDENGLFKF